MRIAGLLAAVCILAIFFSIVRTIDAKVVQSNGGVRDYIHWSMVFLVTAAPVLPFMYWALRTVYTAGGQRLWVMPLTTFAISAVVTIAVFWWQKDELPSGGTLVGLVLAVVAVVCCFVWK